VASIAERNSTECGKLHAINDDFGDHCFQPEFPMEFPFYLCNRSIS
jgi:hypothetical protein